MQEQARKAETSSRLEEGRLKFEREKAIAERNEAKAKAKEGLDFILLPKPRHERQLRFAGELYEVINSRRNGRGALNQSPCSIFFTWILLRNILSMALESCSISNMTVLSVHWSKRNTVLPKI